MTAPNHLTANWIKYGLSPITSRQSLREAASSLLIDGPGARFGVEGLGVFYVSEYAARFYVRDGRVRRRGSGANVKLRPSKVGATLLDECASVTITFDHSGNYGTPWELVSSSRAGQFNVESPTAREDETWKLWRGSSSGVPCYFLAHDSLSEAAIAACNGVLDSGSSQLECLRIEDSMTSVWKQTGSEASHFENLEFSAAADDGSGNYATTNAAYGSESVAHCRARALNFA